MNDSHSEHSVEQRRRPQEYEDPHFHDEDPPPADETPISGQRPRSAAKTGRRLPPFRRRYED
jgi:hypothetical protein